MIRITAAATFLLIMGCNAAREAPNSMCDVPRNFAGWQNTPVRWQGILLDASPHGLSLIAENCQRRGINIQRLPDSAPDEAALNQVLRRGWREPGIIRVDVSGRITSGRTLAVSKVHRVQFEPMNEQQRHEFWRSKGF